jgi:hypothetical protein
VAVATKRSVTVQRKIVAVQRALTGKQETQIVFTALRVARECYMISAGTENEKKD